MDRHISPLWILPIALALVVGHGVHIPFPIAICWMLVLSVAVLYFSRNTSN
jgi:hypothetical protein